MIDKYLRQPSDHHGRVYTVWYDEEQHILHQIYEGRWSWQDFFHAMAQLMVHLLTKREPITILYDLTRSERIPDGIWLLGKYKWVWEPRYWPPSIKRLVVIGTDPLITEALQVRQKVSPHSMRYFRHVQTLDEALQLLADWPLDTAH
jgi:hypothetical protein